MSDLVENGIRYEEADFFVSNPQLKYMTPFNKVWNWRGRSKKYKSKVMWSIFLLLDTRSKFARMNYEDRKEEIETFFMGEKIFHLSLVKEVMAQYPEKVMTLTQRNFKIWDEKITERTQFLKDTPYTLDTYEVLEKMMKDSKGIWDSYMKVKAELEAEEGLSVTRGGFKKSLAEEGGLYDD